MSSKNKIIFVGSITIILLIFLIICFFVPVINIEMNGNKHLTLNVGDTYIEEGANAYIINFFKKEKLDAKITGVVNVNKIGKYIITYRAEKGMFNKEIKRIIEIKDEVKPTITLNKEVRVCKNNNLVELDVTAIDNYDGDISDNITYQIKNNKIYLSVIDSSQNENILESEIKYIDNEYPVLTLKGESEIYLDIGEQYNEPGIKAYDSCDGNITDSIVSESDLKIYEEGTYQIIYKVKDSIGKETKIIRTIIVKAKKDEIINEPEVKQGTIYLTFDDGPGQYTEDILKVLKQYNVKATFFVTNQFPKYRHLIKQEHEEGHSIGIHTYSHKWAIYKSVDAYLEDYTKIEDIVYNEIGMRPKIFRFPGGSSNTVSKNYKKGIMTELASVMTEKGYIYFDWTFDSGDTDKKNNSKKAIITNFKKNLKGDGEYIVLMHDIKKNTFEALPEIIEYATSKGYKFAALTETSPTEHLNIAN